LVRPRAYPNVVATGEVVLIYPHLNAPTRTARVRIELPNPDGRLRPDMYADVEIRHWNRRPRADGVGKRHHRQRRAATRLLDRGRGPFRTRTVKLGRRGDGRVEIKTVSPRTTKWWYRQLPDRRRKQSQGSPARSRGRRQAAMIARLIGWSARNLMLVFIGTVFAVAAGLYALKHLPLDAIPDLSEPR